jgi:hypothetical protein
LAETGPSAGKGNTFSIAKWPFATMPERADTLEAIGLIMFAPLLYSMVSSLSGSD